jgi:superkiller protein 3
LGFALAEQNKLEEAISAYRTAIKLSPNDVTTYYNLGNALSEKNKLEEAISAYRPQLNWIPTMLMLK